MSLTIRNVAVLGSGVMGAGISAHIANAGIPVLLLDIIPSGVAGDAPAAKKNSLANSALATLAKNKPAAFFSEAQRALVRTGNLTDDLAEAAHCDLVIEAVVERLDIKQSLFEKLQALRLPHTIIASNTSGLKIADMLAGRSAEFCGHFLVMHFFNPPRYMKLLELVAGPATLPEVMTAATTFGRERLGKGIVVAKDTPNFIANRVGTYSFILGIHQMTTSGLAPEDVDLLTGEVMGRPKSATFRTGDMVGIDTTAHVVANCYAQLTQDEEREVFTLPAYVKNMLAQKQLGDKTKGGFYKKTPAGIMTLDPQTGEYRAKAGNEAIAKACKALGKESDVGKRLQGLVNLPEPAGTFAWTVLAKTLAYAARRIGEISDDVVSVDNAMKWGFNWDIGPFELWDAMGVAATVERMKKSGIAVPESIDRMLATKGATSFYQGDKVFDLRKGEYVPLVKDRREVTVTTARKGSAPVLSNGGAEVWDIGDGALCFTMKTKANSIDGDVIGLLHKAVGLAESDFRALVIANTGDNFCVGANLFLVAMAAGQKQWDKISELVGSYQQVVQRMKYALVPIVAAPYGMTLGGGLELCLGASSVQAAAETYSGLVEVGVGLLPGGAGTMNLLWRAFENIPAGSEVDNYAIVTNVFKNIAMAKVATSAEEAKEFGYLRRSDGVSFDRARLLWEAKARALGLADAGYHPPTPRAYKLPGDSGIATLQMLVNTLIAGGFATEHDGLIARKVATVLCGGKSGHTHDVTEKEMLDLEREAFVSLCGEPKSQERMQHMLMNNKPLRN